MNAKKGETCKHGEKPKEDCRPCWVGKWCRLCWRKIKEGEIAWWCPGLGPQCRECRDKVPTVAQAAANLKKIIEDLEKLSGHVAPCKPKTKPKFKMPQREE